MGWLAAAEWLDWRGIRLGAWALAAIVALALRSTGRPKHVAAAAWFLAVPPSQSLLVFLDSIEVLRDPSSVLSAISPRRLSRIFSRSLLADIGYAGVGLAILVSGGKRSNWAAWRPGSAARWLQARGWPTGGRSEMASLRIGLLLFPLVLVAAWGVNLILYGTLPELRNGDESSVWNHMTLYHAILISLAAGVGEEIWYRGIYQTLLARVMPVSAAIVLQALLFGFAHAGYGTWAHVLGPALFGLLAGVVAWRFGLWAAIVLHTLADVAAFGFEATRNQPWVGPLLLSLLLANLLVSLLWLANWLRRGFRQQVSGMQD